ncbi:hypothetical protein Tco_0684582 [Tanacetum coccineum]
MGDTIAQTMSENVSKLSNDPLLARVSSSRRVEFSEDEGLGEEDASKQGRIADIDADAGITLDNTHFDADTDMFGVHELDGDEVIVDNEDVITTAEETRSVVEEVTVVIIPVSAATTTTTTTAITDVEMTLAQALTELKSAKPKADKQAPTPTVSSQQPSQEIQDKGKGKMVEPKPVKKMSKKELLRLDEELAFKLQAEEEEERLAREKA